MEMYSMTSEHMITSRAEFRLFWRKLKMKYQW